MTTVLVKVEIENESNLTDALEGLVERHGASFYTLVRDGSRVRVDSEDSHLLPERYEASLYAHAAEMHLALMNTGRGVPVQLALDYGDYIEGQYGREVPS